MTFASNPDGRPDSGQVAGRDGEDARAYSAHQRPFATEAPRARALADLGAEPPAAHVAFVPQARFASETERLAWYSQIVEALAKVSERAATPHDPWRPLWTLVDEWSRLLGNHAASVYRYEPEGRLLRLICGHVDGRTGDELPGHPYGRADLPMPIDAFPAWAELTASSRPQVLWMPPESTTPPSNEWHVHHRHRYIIRRALMVQGKPLGLLGLAFQSDLCPDSAQWEAFAVLAQHLTLILQQAELALKIQQAADLERAQAVIIAREQATRRRSAELEHANAALTVSGDLLRLLAAATRKILEAPDLISGIHGLLRRLGESTQLSRVLFFLERASASGEKEHYVVTEWCAPGIADHRSVGIEVIPNRVAKPFLDRMQGRDAFWLDMRQAEEPMRSALLSLKTLSTGCAPVTIDGEYAGVIAFDDCVTVRSDEVAHVDAFLAAANIIGSALQRERATERRAADLIGANAVLQRAISGLGSIHSLNDFIAELLTESLRVSDAQTGAVALIVDDRVEHTVLVEQGRRVAWQAGEGDGNRGQPLPPALRDTMLGALQADGLWAPSPEHAAFATALVEFHGTRGNRAVRCVPMAVEGRLIGWVELGFAQVPVNDQVRRGLLKLLAQQMTAAVELARLADAERLIAVSREREQAATARAEELGQVNSALQAAARGLIRESKLDDVLPTILQTAMDAAGAACGAVLRRLDATTEFAFEVISQDGLLLAGRSLEAHPLTLQVRDASRRDRAHYFARLAAGEAVWRVTDDEQAGPLAPSSGWDEPRGRKAVWDIPFSVGNRVTGYLALAFTRSDGLSESVKETVNALATQVALAMQLKLLAESDKHAAVLREQKRAAVHRAAELERSSEALQRTIDAVSELQTLNDFVPGALRIVAEAFGAISAAYWEHPEDRIYLRFWLLDGAIFGPRELPGLSTDQYAVMTQLAEGFSVPREHLNADLHDRIRPSIVHHATATASPALHQFALGMGWEWELNVPLIISGRAEGALTLYRGPGRAFTEAEFALAEGLAKQMALAMRISRLAERERGAATARAVALERLRIAADMHDSLAQSFTSIALQSESLRSRTPESSAAADTLRVIELTARQGLAEVRASVLTLHSLDGPPGTLDKALGQLAARCTVPGSIRCDFVSSGEPCELAGDTRESLMRIAREALNNAMRHSGGTRIRLTLAYGGGRVRMSVEDDGSGLTDDAGHARPGYGLEGMTRRAEMIGGALEFLRSALGGAMVAVDLPCVSPQTVRKDPWA